MCLSEGVQETQPDVPASCAGGHRETLRSGGGGEAAAHYFVEIGIARTGGREGHAKFARGRHGGGEVRGRVGRAVIQHYFLQRAHFVGIEADDELVPGPAARVTEREDGHVAPERWFAIGAFGRGRRRGREWQHCIDGLAAESGLRRVQALAGVTRLNPMTAHIPTADDGEIPREAQRAGLLHGRFELGHPRRAEKAGRRGDATPGLRQRPCQRSVRRPTQRLSWPGGGPGGIRMNEAVQPKPVGIRPAAGGGC